MFRIILLSTWWLLITNPPVASGEDTYIQLFLTNPVNVIYENFISFSIDPNYLINGVYYNTIGENSFKMAKQMSPAFVKINGNPRTRYKIVVSEERGQKRSLVNKTVEVTTDGLKIFSEWLSQAGLTPVLPLNYFPGQWQPRDAIRTLTEAQEVGLTNCIWQLGADFNSTTAEKYVDDLKTLKRIMKSFPAREINWGIMGADLSPGSDFDEVKRFYESGAKVFEATSWIQKFDQDDEKQENLLHSPDPALRYLIRKELPTWLVMEYESKKSLLSTLSACDEYCLQDGLFWAQLLGDASRAGLSSVFKPLSRLELTTPTLSYYVSLYFKQLIGEKVFPVTFLSGSRTSEHYYAFCAKNYTGGLVLLTVNSGNTRVRTTVRMPLRNNLGDEIQQYLLTVSAGFVYLNNAKLSLDASIDPVVKNPNVGRPLVLSVPAHSIGFWEFTHADLDVCKRYSESIETSGSNEVEEEAMETEQKSSTDLLIQQLILETLKGEKRQKRHTIVKKDGHQRMRRSLVTPEEMAIQENLLTSDREKRFILAKSDSKIHGPKPTLSELLKTGPPKKLFKKHFIRPRRQSFDRVRPTLPPLPTLKPLKDLFPPRKTIPKALVETTESVLSSAEERILKSMENKNLPEGDVFIDVGTIPAKKEGEYDYVEFNEAEVIEPKKKEPKRQQIQQKKPEDDGYIYVPKEYMGSFRSNPPLANVQDLELDVAGSVLPTAQNSQTGNAKYALLVKEQSPIDALDQLKLQKTKQALSEMYLSPDSFDSPSKKEDENLDLVEDIEDSLLEEFGLNENSEKSLESEDNIEDFEEDGKNKRIFEAIEELLHKFESRVSEKAKIRTRREVSVDEMPRESKRKFKKAIGMSFKHSLKPKSLVSSVDIKEIKLSEGIPIREKRAISIFDQSGSWERNDIRSRLGLNSIDSDADSVEEVMPKTFYSNQRRAVNLVPHGDFKVSAEFVMRPEGKATTTSTTPTTTTTTTTTTTERNEILRIPLNKDFDAEMQGDQPASTETTQEKDIPDVFHELGESFVDLFHNVSKYMNDFWKSFF